MSTARKSAAAPRKSAAAKRGASTATAEFVCPECGRTFTRAAALGAHRSRAHGVAGQSSQALRSRTRRQSAKRAPARAASSPSTRATTATRANGIDRDALLKALFPGGVPPREDVIRAVSGWLDDAEQLARMR